MKHGGAELYPHEIITNPPTQQRKKKENNVMSSSHTPTTPITTTHAPLTDETKIKATQVTSMESRQLHSGQKEAMKKIPEFSGEENELDIDEWLFDLTNLFSLMKLTDETKILETMAKLTGSALRWYQENLKSFVYWDDAEIALKVRFKEFTSDSQLMQEFFQIRQEENQSTTSFYENVIRKYRKAKRVNTEQQVITVLQTGVKNPLKEHLIRNEKVITKPDEWLQYAREEEYIQKRIQQQRNGLYPETTTQPFFQPMLPTATIQSKLLSTQSLNRYKHQEKQHQPYYHSFNNQAFQQQNKYQSV